jgi:hypothetical protein
VHVNLGFIVERTSIQPHSPTFDGELETQLAAIIG